MKTRRILSALLSMLPLAAFAHIGNDAGVHHVNAFLQGLIHPFTGMDHMAAMLAVGMWSALVFRASPMKMWSVPLAFAALLMVGGLIGFAGASASLVEPMIAASLLVLGLLVATQFRLSVVPGALLVGAFAIFHGIAHGSELPAQQAIAVLGGMIAGTMSLHVIGMLIGHRLLNRNVWLPRLTGALVTLLGLGLLFGVLEA